MKMKEDLVLIEAFSIIFNKVILSMNVEHIHLIIPVIEYQSGSRQVFLIIWMMIIRKVLKIQKQIYQNLKMMEECMFIYKVIILNKIVY